MSRYNQISFLNNDGILELQINNHKENFKNKNSFVEIKEVIKKIGKRIKIHIIPIPKDAKNNLSN